MKVPLFLLTVLSLSTLSAAPLDDPISTRITPGEIVVGVTDFVRVPRTADPHKRLTHLAGTEWTLGSSDAWSRIQYLQPLRDGTGRLAINELRGVLYLTDETAGKPEVYLDLRKSTPDFDGGIFPNEAGFLGFAFHPDFARVGTWGYGKFYTGYSARANSGTADYLQSEELSHLSVIREWTADDPLAHRFTGSSRVLLRVGQFAQNHNVGTLAFNHAASRDSVDFGKLYICLGDGGSAFDPYNHGQRLDTPLGSIIRIDPVPDEHNPYRIPEDNPFTAYKQAAGEIWAYGLRHPQHFSFDSSGRLLINDIGQNQVEEVNLGVRGGNYGWRLREGTFATGYAVGEGMSGFVYSPPPGNSFIDPIAQYDHDEGNAISSGFVYEGSAIAALKGQYVAADIVTGRLFYFDLMDALKNVPVRIRELRLIIDGIEQSALQAFGYENSYAAGTKRVDLRLGRDDTGELYLLTKGDGWVRKLVPVDHQDTPHSQ